jgi:hypothetical protein
MMDRFGSRDAMDDEDVVDHTEEIQQSSDRLRRFHPSCKQLLCISCKLPPPQLVGVP